MLLVKPPVGLSTPEIFKALDLTRRSTVDPEVLLSAMGKGQVDRECCVNDLEQPAFDRYYGGGVGGGGGGGQHVFMHMSCVCMLLYARGSYTTLGCVCKKHPPSSLVYKKHHTHRLPELADLRADLERDGDFSAVFMTGSGSTIVGLGSETPPQWLEDRPELFVSPARLIVRQEGAWYVPSGVAVGEGAAQAVAA